MPTPSTYDDANLILRLPTMSREAKNGPSVFLTQCERLELNPADSQFEAVTSSTSRR